MFNVHKNVTADGVIITEGLEVFTNELEVGKVISDDNDHDFSCCAPTDSHDNTIPADVLRTHYDEDQLHSRGQIRLDNGWYTDHQNTCPPSVGGFAYCRHDHWFTVQTRNGTKSFNGERLVTTAPIMGKSAKQAWVDEYN